MGTYIRKRLLAVHKITHMRFLPRMRARMHRQRRPLDKALSAVWEAASIRPFIGVYPKVSAQIRLAIEDLYRKRVSLGTVWQWD